MNGDRGSAASGSAPRPAVFLDRDGTMIHDVNYLSRLDDLSWFPYTVDAIRLLNRAGFLVIVLTNQGGVGLELYDESFVHEVHEAMAARVAAGGARVDGWFYCPHHPLATRPALRLECDCRKPRPGLVHQAQQRFPIDLARSFIVGDKRSDLGLAANVGARGVHVRTGHGETELKQDAGALESAAFMAADLMDAVSWILLQSGHPREDR